MEQKIDEMIPTRRRFIASAVAAALGVSLSAVLDAPALDAAPQTSPGCGVSGQPFVPVAEFVSRDNSLNATLHVKGANKMVANIGNQGYQCSPLRLRYYEGQQDGKGPVWPPSPSQASPGPTFRARIGDKVAINLINSINPADFPRTNPSSTSCNTETQIVNGQAMQIYPGTDTPPSCFHASNTTNLHYHGFHVTPKSPGDYVMEDVNPGGHFENMFTITVKPPDSNFSNYKEPFMMGQPPGTQWYHAHKHGATALQLLNGMAGAFIVEGEFDEQLEQLIPGLAKSEKVLVIQQIGATITIMGGPQTPYACVGGDALPLVNGQLQPTIAMAPGEIQRWRLINATMQQTSYMKYQFPAGSGFTIRQIAYDGIQIAPERYGDTDFGQSQEFTLAPGGRVDLLVQAPSAGGSSALGYQMLDPQATAGCPPHPPFPDQVLVKVNTSGQPITNMNFPTAANFPKLPLYLVWDEKDPRNQIKRSRVLKFNNDSNGRPEINGLPFDDGPLTTEFIALNAAEEWTLENWWNSSIHPFHIHVNPFQVLEIFDPNTMSAPLQMKAPYIWRDTIALPLANASDTSKPPIPGYVKMRSRFVDFDGQFVLHCHILDHEDRGMMQSVQILDPKSPTIPPLMMHH
jgi:FtsP/CotA-like multicopper oxidase with cupredoxin domain